MEPVNEENIENEPKTEEPKVEEPKTEEPKVEETKSEEVKAEEPKADKLKNIKIGIVAAGGVFILLALVYMAAILGGKNTAIEQEQEPEPVVVVYPTETPAVTDTPTVEPTVEVVEEEKETPAESLLCAVQGHARYDECVYADGGVIVVRKGDKYGAINYDGEEIVPLKYTEVKEFPTKEGMFVLSVSKSETVTEEKDGTTYNYEEVTTTYTLFNCAGTELYKGNDKVVASNNTMILGIEDREDSRRTRVEYYRLGSSGKPYITMYTNELFSPNGFMDSKTTVMGYLEVPTKDQATNPTKLVCGTMDEKGNVMWFAKAPGIADFEEVVKQWQEENKEAKVDKEDTAEDADKKDIDKEDTDKEAVDTEDAAEDADKEGIDKEDTDTDDVESDDTDEDLDSEDSDKEQDTDFDDLSGPEFQMGEILNAPVGGFFIYKDPYDVNDPYSWYTEYGEWYADLDITSLEPDAQNGFKVGKFNNGAVKVKGYVMDGEIYYNFGALMVLTVGDKDVLIDMSKAKGMKADKITNKIVIAVFDEINISESNYWMYKDGDKAGYIDLKGQPLKYSYEDATSFNNGYALAVRDGKAIVISESFRELEEIGDSSGVDIAGDVMNVMTDNGVRRYMLKSIKANPVDNSLLPNARADEAVSD